MPTLIVYATRYGCTEKCASLLAEKIGGEVKLHNLRNNREVDLGLYDKVVVGGSIYIGRIQKEVGEFCRQNLSRFCPSFSIVQTINDPHHLSPLYSIGVGVQ